MVPVTRNPFPSPTQINSPPSPGDPDYMAYAEHLRSYQLAHKKGVLDLYARQAPANVTLMRGTAMDPVNAFDLDNNATNPDTAGVARFSAQPLYLQPAPAQRNPLTDFGPIMRLKKLTTERSNVFAVYMTVGLFEYDAATGNIGIEYGADRGEAQRYRAFFVVDRSKPVGYQVGVDHNVENTILVRRYLKTDD